MIIVSKVRQIDTDVASFLQAMQIDESKKSIAMVDVETNNPSASKFKKLRIFDFAYGMVNPFDGQITGVESNLVYEGMINPEVIEQTIEWNKIKNASFNSYYGVFNLLREQDWWSERIASREEISQETVVGAFQRTATEKLYKIQNKHLPEQKRILKVWETTQSTWKTANKYRAERTADIAKMEVAIKDLENWLQDTNNLNTLIQSGNFLGNPTYDSIMRSVYTSLYTEQYERASMQDFRLDQKTFRQIEQKMNVSFSHNIKRWGDTIYQFDNDLKNNKDLLAITAYNISHERNAIKQMNRDFGISSDMNVLDGERYRSICMQNMMGLLTKKESEDIIKGLNSYDPNFFIEGVAESLRNTGKLETRTFEAFYEYIFDTKGYKQTHTAKGDVVDQSKALTEAFQQHIIPYLEGRK